MAKLHELLAAEKTVVDASKKLMAGTNDKFQRVDQYFVGSLKTLSIIKDDASKKSLEDAGRAQKELVTTVPDTLAYAMNFWAKAEDLLYQKNKSNQQAQADIVFRGKTIATDVPVDELMGLEARLTELRNTMALIPTLDAGQQWKRKTDSDKNGVWETVNPVVSTKTEKVVTPVVLYAATEQHPAQIEKVSKDEVVGTFSEIKFSGSATSKQKADIIANIDELIAEVKQARCRANEQEVVKVEIGKTLTDLILAPLKD